MGVKNDTSKFLGKGPQSNVPVTSPHRWGSLTRAYFYACEQKDTFSCILPEKKGSKMNETNLSHA